MIVLMTDFGITGPYIGQMKARLAHHAPEVPVIDLFSDLPEFNPQAAAYLIPAYCMAFPPCSVFLCVVDPGVGSDRPCVAVQADEFWFVGPDNGQFDIVARRFHNVSWRDITWRPEQGLSASFHGRDLFAPVAAMLAAGRLPDEILGKSRPAPESGWPDELDEIVYIDHYGNAISGRRACSVNENTVFQLGDTRLGYARVFSEVSAGTGFWYQNANGLVEFAVNRGRADVILGAGVGSSIQIVE